MRKHNHKFVEADYLNGNIKMLSVYINSKVKNNLLCLICDHKWEATYDNFKSSINGCPKCSGKLKHTQEFVEAEYLKSNIKILSVYISNKIKNDLLCLICDHKWGSTFNNFYSNKKNCPECWRLSNIGENNPSWNHELTKEDRENSYQRNHISGNKEWTKAVYDRDGHTCQSCNIRGGTLNAHHIDSWKDHKDDRFNIDNGVTLCKTCHTACHAYHKKRYYPSATYNLFYEWMAKYSVIKPENWSWTVRYPDAMNKRLIFFKRAS